MKVIGTGTGNDRKWNWEAERKMNLGREKMKESVQEKHRIPVGIRNCVRIVTILTHMLSEFIESLWWNWTKLRVYYEYIVKNPMGMLLSIFWVNYERTFDEWLRYIVGIFWTNLWKKPKGLFQRVAQRYIGGFSLIKLSICPLGILRSKWWAFFE